MNEREREDARFAAILKEKAGFSTSKELIAWARGEILLGIGEGKYQTAVFDVMTTAITWGVEVNKLNTPPVSGPLIRELETLREWKQQALTALVALPAEDLPKYQGHPVADFVIAARTAKLDPGFERTLRKDVDVTRDKIMALRKELDSGVLGRERSPTAIRAQVAKELADIFESAGEILARLSSKTETVERERKKVGSR